MKRWRCKNARWVHSKVWWVYFFFAEPCYTEKCLNLKICLEAKVIKNWINDVHQGFYFLKSVMFSISGLLFWKELLLNIPNKKPTEKQQQNHHLNQCSPGIWSFIPQQFRTASRGLQLVTKNVSGTWDEDRKMIIRSSKGRFSWRICLGVHQVLASFFFTYA